MVVCQPLSTNTLDPNMKMPQMWAQVNDAWGAERVYHVREESQDITAGESRRYNRVLT
jgi:hypothetical protein